ncbi:hypothetical protein TgHK011_006127 [Trichoderma gracile]|nr:hypothetical protein TgHK011_006127 [Trichoderma gracile]
MQQPANMKKNRHTVYCSSWHLSPAYNGQQRVLRKRATSLSELSNLQTGYPSMRARRACSSGGSLTNSEPSARATAAGGDGSLVALGRSRRGAISCLRDNKVLTTYLAAI